MMTPDEETRLLDAFELVADYYATHGTGHQRSVLPGWLRVDADRVRERNAIRADIPTRRGLNVTNEGLDVTAPYLWAEALTDEEQRLVQARLDEKTERDSEDEQMSSRPATPSYLGGVAIRRRLAFAAHDIVRSAPILHECRCGVAFPDRDEWAVHVAAEIRKARTVTTREALHALPENTVIRDAAGWTFVLMDDSLLTDDPEPVWKSPGWASLDVNLPAIVLWHPEVDHDWKAVE